MNGYETMSENYKILMQRGEIEKEAAEKAIRVYDFLAGCDTDDLCEPHMTKVTCFRPL